MFDGITGAENGGMKMSQQQRARIKTVIQDAIDKALCESCIFKEMSQEGVWGDRLISFAADAVVAVIESNFNGQQTALEMEVVKKIQ